MAIVVFYEKPGCASNTRQKVLLAASGHTVLARSLLTEKWNAQRLRAFFGALPVAAWFNPSAPRIKSGEVRPDALDEAAALDLMLADPLLIRRPLMTSTASAGPASTRKRSTAGSAWRARCRAPASRPAPRTRRAPVRRWAPDKRVCPVKWHLPY